MINSISNKIMRKKKDIVIKAAVLLFWVLVWELGARLLRRPLLLPPLSSVFRTLLGAMDSMIFWKSIFRSLSGIATGFLGALILGVVMGFLSDRFFMIKLLLEPLVAGMKSVPVASFIILALIWLGSQSLSILTAFLVTFPVLYINTLEGLALKDKKMEEMSKVFRMSRLRKWLYIDMAAVLPFIISGTKVAVGMSWKTGIAAEVIGVPKYSIGENLYMSKIYLDTSGLFAWTIVVVLLSLLSEKLMVALLKAGGKLWE